MTADVFDDRVCKLGEGPLWHPERQQLFWFDILSKQLLTRIGENTRHWQFDEHVSAAGWVGRDTLLIASETQLFRFDLNSGDQTYVHALEAENPVTRSNDGRADPWGGFWIGTMGKHAEPGAGAIYRYWDGELRKLIADITVSNAICFSPDKSCAYFTDTHTKTVMMQPLDLQTGWPNGEASAHLDLTDENLNPDGAVTDAEGNLWIAEWGSFRVACYDSSGTRIRTIETGSAQTSCPAWGGSDFRTLFMTSAAVGLSADHKDRYPRTGQTFVAKDAGLGRPEPRVIL